MSLRTRLVLSLAVTLAVALLLAGLALVGLTRQSLLDRVDQELTSIVNAGDRLIQLQDLTGGAGGEAGRRIAVLRLDRRGAIVRSFPSGFASDPDPLPVLPGYQAGIPPEAFGRIDDRSSSDGTVDYRVLMGRGRAGVIIAIAAPLSSVEDATRALIRTLAIVGGLAILALTGIAFFIVRRGLLPLERIARTAADITDGDLTQRAGVPHDDTEVGRLGAAFDTMLDQIESSFGEQRAALDAKARSEDQLRRFVADASHELRTPLTAIRGYADLYRAGGLADRVELEAAMERLGTESRRMGLLVDDLLLLARLDQGRPLRRDPVDLSRITTEAVADARAVEPARPLVDAIDPGIVVTGDEDRLRQVIGNLVANVRVHTAPGAPAEIVLRRDGDDAELRVVDQGPGIDPEHAPRVFDRFYRADPGRSRDRGGSGLGLSIVASITHALGGRIRHEATPGGGATFVMRLQLTVPPNPTLGVPPASPTLTARSQPVQGEDAASTPIV